jgi:hypothetical protein
VVAFSGPAVDSPQGLRLLTPRECARLQGFPDEYKLPDNDHTAYKQVGNAVCVPVVKAILENLKAHVLKGSVPVSVVPSTPGENLKAAIDHVAEAEALLADAQSRAREIIATAESVCKSAVDSLRSLSEKYLKEHDTLARTRAAGQV